MQLEFHHFLRGEKPFFTIALWTHEWTPQVGMTVQLPAPPEVIKELRCAPGLLDFEIAQAFVEFSFQKLEAGDHPTEAFEAFVKKIVYVVKSISWGTRDPARLVPLPDRPKPPAESSFHHNDPKPPKKSKRTP